VLRPLAGDDDAFAGDRPIARIRGDRLHLGHGLRIAGGARPGQSVLEAEPLVGAHVDHLADADVGMEQVRPLQRRAHAHHRAPAVAGQHHLALAVALAQVAGDGDRIVHVLLDGQGAVHRLRRIEAERAARGALVVVGDGEVVLQRALELPQGRDHRRGRPAMDEQQQRVAAVLPAHVDPVAHAVERHLVRFLHAFRGDDPAQLGDQRAARRVGLAVRAGIRGPRAQRRQQQAGQHDGKDAHHRQLRSGPRRFCACPAAAGICRRSRATGVPAVAGGMTMRTVQATGRWRRMRRSHPLESSTCVL